MEIETIKSILQSAYPVLEEEDLKLLLGICEYKMLPKKKVFIKVGQKSDDTFFILQGMVRGYFMDKNGEEKNIFLRPEKTISGAPESLFMEQPSRYTFESVLETHLLVFKFRAIKALATENKAIFEVYSNALQENLITLVGRVQSLIASTPEERYEQMIAQSPHFFQSALSKHVANYLGITPNSLSRIIRRKSKN